MKGTQVQRPENEIEQPEDAERDPGDFRELAREGGAAVERLDRTAQLRDSLCRCGIDRGHRGGHADETETLRGENSDAGTDATLTLFLRKHDSRVMKTVSHRIESGNGRSQILHFVFSNVMDSPELECIRTSVVFSTFATRNLIG